MAKDREQRELARLQHSRLHEFVRRQDVLAILARFRRPLQHVFRYFSKQDAFELSAGPETNSTVNFAKFSKLCSTFRLVPELMSAEDLVYVYRQATRSQSQPADSSPVATDTEKKKAPHTLDFEVGIED